MCYQVLQSNTSNFETDLFDPNPNKKYSVQSGSESNVNEGVIHTAHN